MKWEELVLTLSEYIGRTKISNIFGFQCEDIKDDRCYLSIQRRREPSICAAHISDNILTLLQPTLRCLTIYSSPIYIYAAIMKPLQPKKSFFNKDPVRKALNKIAKRSRNLAKALYLIRDHDLSSQVIVVDGRIVDDYVEVLRCPKIYALVILPEDSLKVIFFGERG